MSLRRRRASLGELPPFPTSSFSSVSFSASLFLRPLLLGPLRVSNVVLILRLAEFFFARAAIRAAAHNELHYAMRGLLCSGCDIARCSPKITCGEVPLSLLYHRLRRYVNRLIATTRAARLALSSTVNQYLAY